MTTPGTAALTQALERLRAELTALPLPLEVAGVAATRGERAALLAQLDDYLLPRLRSLDAPLLAVVGGSTGAGKSTLVNALVGARVTAPGVLRPTTRAPVLVHHPDDTPWFTGDRILPGLARVTGAAGDAGRTLRLVPHDAMPRGLALLDAPDVDSVVTANRELAAQLLAAADLWLFVTTAARYADAVPWDLLRDAAARSAAVSVVLDRVAPDDADEVARDLARLLAEEQLGDSPLFVVPETRLGPDGALPPSAVAPLSAWLRGLAADAAARAEVVRRTLDGALSRTVARVAPLADAVDAQAEALTRLRTDVEVAYAGALSDIDRATRDGTLLRGEVLARWQEFVGTGELLRTVEERIGRLRDRIGALLRGQPQPGADVGVALEHGIEALIHDAADAAAERASDAWRADPAGAAILDATPLDLARVSPDLPERAAKTVREWQDGVLQLVREEGQDKRTSARFLALGVNGLAVALMVVAFAHTGGLVGAEVGIAGGAAVVGQRLLEAVFGDQAVRELAARARADLDERAGVLLAEEQARFTDLLDEAGVDADAGARLREAAATLARACSEGFA